MAGAEKGENTHFVPCALLPLQHGTDWCCKKLLPDLDAWRRQARSRNGDKSTCCDKFLNEILPCFVEVLAQDGIYFVKDFPQHPMSHMLRVSFRLCLSNNFPFESYRVNFRTEQNTWLRAVGQTRQRVGRAEKNYSACGPATRAKH
jgi:hypothetical protein